MVRIENIELCAQPVVLAPMEDVTDRAFRELCKHFGVNLVFTEFISSEGLIRNAKKSLLKVEFSDIERPIGIQIFGNNVDSMRLAAERAEQANPDLIDINFGCSVKKVLKMGAGAAIFNPTFGGIKKMVKIAEAVVKSTKLPVSVKTRLGWDDKNKPIVELAERLQDVGIKALTIHGRTVKQGFKQKADWTLIGEVKNNPRIHIPIIGNGDIDSPQKAKQMFETYGVDGIMIGRATIGNPWILEEIKHFLRTGEILPKPSLAEKIETCIKHLEKSIAYKGEKIALLEIRKHYAGYFKEIPFFKPYRIKLMNAKSFEEVKSIFKEFYKNNKVAQF